MSEAVLSQPKSATAAEPSRLAPKRRSLAAKLAIALVGLITLVLLINGGANLWLNYDDAKRAILGVQLEKAQAAAERVDGFISDVENQIGWTTRAEWRRVPVEQQRYDLIRLLRQAPAVTEVSYLDPSGKEVYPAVMVPKCRPTPSARFSFAIPQKCLPMPKSWRFCYE